MTGKKPKMQRPQDDGIQRLRDDVQRILRRLDKMERLLVAEKSAEKDMLSWDSELTPELRLSRLAVPGEPPIPPPPPLPPLPERLRKKTGTGSK